MPEEKPVDMKEVLRLVNAGEYEVIQRAGRPNERKKETEESAAGEIFGEDFLGPEAVMEAFKVELDDVPPIPFSKQELERAKELNQMLVLRVDIDPAGNPLTMERMQAMLQKHFNDHNLGKILYNTDWYKNEDFFKSDTPKLGWALVSKEVIPSSTSKNYFAQTEQLIEYLKNDIFGDQALPQVYQDAVDEFEDNKSEIAVLMDQSSPNFNWQEAAKRLSELQINQMLRQNPAEVLYDMLIKFLSSNPKERFLPNIYTWTNRRNSGGNLVIVGYSHADGASVSHWGPDDSDDDVGVCASWAV